MSAMATTATYLASYTCKFQIEGVDADTAARIAHDVFKALEREFAELVRDKAEVAPDRPVTAHVERHRVEECERG